MDPALRSGYVTFKPRSGRDALIDLVSQLRESLDLATNFQAGVTGARRILRADRVIVYQFDHHYIGTTVAESVGSGWTPCLGLEIIDTCFQTTRAAQYGSKNRVNVIPDVYQAGLTDCHLALLERFEVKANLVVPVFVRSQVWGLLIAHQCSGIRQWHELDITVMMQIASQLALSIQQAVSIQIEKELELERQAAAERETLLRLISRIPRPLTMSETLEITVSELRQALQVDRAAIFRFDPDWSGEFVAESVGPDWTSLLQLQETYPQIKDSVKDCVLQKLGSLTAEASVTLDAFIQGSLRGEDSVLVFRTVEDIHTADLSQPVLQMLEHYQARAYLVVGIFLNGQIWGLLAVYQNSRPRRWKQAEINLVYQVATQLTVVLQHLTLRQQDQARIQELEQFHQLKDDFLSTVSHELRTPLASIRMATEMLKQTVAARPINPDRIQRYLKVLESECHREINLVEDLLNLQRLAAKPDPVNLDQVDVKFVLRQLIDTSAVRAQEYRVNLSYAPDPELPNLWTEASSLDRILAELLNNACKYTEANGEIRVEATAIPQDGIPGIRLTVGNTGTIPKDELPRIFDKFYRVPQGDPYQRGGTGLGLSLVKALVDALRGKIAATSENNWTAFEVWLPQRMPLARILEFPVS
jgi:signal transduction histidine kinase